MAHKTRTRPRLLLSLMTILLLAGALTPCRAAGAADEFIGPLAGWADLRRDYRAAGDGRTDDTAALQKALDELGTPGRARVLFVPTGTYRITRGLTMTSHMDVSVFGENPATTTIRWDGPAGGEMLDCNGVRYSRFGRLTWDGVGRAKTAVNAASVEVQDFHGDLVFLTTIFSGRLVVRGEGSDTRVLLGGVLGTGDAHAANESPRARFAFFQSLRYTPGGGAAPLPGRGTADPDFLRRMLAPVRNERPRPLGALPSGVTDVRLYRVTVQDALVGIRLTANRSLTPP